MNAIAIRTRIAPTPSGFLHIGNLYSFIHTWLLAKSAGGQVLLRIDDLDAQRMRVEYIEDIFRTLDFCGLEPDEGPSGVKDFLQNYSQQWRMPLYHQKLDTLKQIGSLYACNCSRKKLRESWQNEGYPGFCREAGLSLEDPDTAWRIRVPKGIRYEFSGPADPLMVEIGEKDFIIRRRDGIPAYQLASMADDLHYKINLVVRGQDLLFSTAAQLYLSEVLQEKEFQSIQWVHHPLLVNEQGNKLSKSAGETSIRWMVEQGMQAPDLFSTLAPRFGIAKQNFSTLHELLDAYLKINAV